MQSTSSISSNQVVVDVYMQGEKKSITFTFIERAQQVAQPIFEEAFQQISDQATGEDDNLYLTSNEGDRDRTYEIMRNHPVAHEAALFVSGFFGLDVASMRGENSQTPSKKLSYLISIDCSPRMQKLWKPMDTIICQSTDEKQALESIKQKLKTNANVFWNDRYGIPPKERADHYCDQLEQEVQAGKSWLSTPERFKIIQSIFKARHFLFKPIDLCDEEGMRKLCCTVKALNIKFDTVYLSNVKEYAEAQGKLSLFRKAVSQLNSVVSNETFFIDTKCRIGGTPLHLETLNQRVTQKFLNNSMEKRFVSSPLPDLNSVEFKTSTFSPYETFLRNNNIKTLEELTDPAVRQNNLKN